MQTNLLTTLLACVSLIPYSASEYVRGGYSNQVDFPFHPRYLQKQPAVCIAVPDCAALNLTGSCCPTSDGTFAVSFVVPCSVLLVNAAALTHPFALLK
jgi:hypothetical protein